MVRKLTIAFIGHRPDRLAGYDLTQPFYKNLQKRLEDIIRGYLDTHNEIHCRSGLALGADTVWSKAILAVRERYPHRVFFHADIPMKEQASSWSNSEDVDFWHYQVEQADSKTIYGSLADYDESERRHISVRMRDERNRGRLSPADVVIAVFDGSSKGGTANAVRFAKRTGKKLIVIDPDTIEREKLVE